MSASKSAIKPGELRNLTDAQLAFVVARCALRTAPWVSTVTDKTRQAAARKAWSAGARFLTQAAAKGTWDAAKARRHVRAVQSVSARVANGGDDEAGYALLALATACEALASSGERKRFVKASIDAGKYAASIAALSVHAGRVKAKDVGVGAAKDAKTGVIVDAALALVWDAARADIAAAAVSASRDVNAKLWPEKAPAFWPT